MTIVTKYYTNGFSRALDVTAVAATEDVDTVEVTTADDGALHICRHDDPIVWQQLITLGLMPA